MEQKMDPTEVPMLKLNINGDDEEKAEVVADKKNQYLATVAGKKYEKRAFSVWFFISRMLSRLFSLKS